MDPPLCVETNSRSKGRTGCAFQNTIRTSHQPASSSELTFSELWCLLLVGPHSCQGQTSSYLDFGAESCPKGRAMHATRFRHMVGWHDLHSSSVMIGDHDTRHTMHNALEVPTSSDQLRQWRCFGGISSRLSLGVITAPLWQNLATGIEQLGSASAVVQVPSLLIAKLADTLRGLSPSDRPAGRHVEMKSSQPKRH